MQILKGNLFKRISAINVKSAALKKTELNELNQYYHTDLPKYTHCIAF